MRPGEVIEPVRIIGVLHAGHHRWDRYGGHAFARALITGEEPELPTYLYRLGPDGRLDAAAELRSPNGLAFSPDESVLYVVESRAIPHRRIVAYDVRDGSLGEQRPFIDCGDGIPDGLRIDEDGNLWCGWGGGEGLDGVRVFALDATPIGHIDLPERCANLAFGGRARNRLFLAAHTSLYALYVNVRGVRR